MSVLQNPVSVLKSIAEAAAVFIAITFIGGWSYLAGYYKTFGLNPVELDVSVPVAATIGVHSLVDAGWPLPALGASLIALTISARVLPTLRQHSYLNTLGVVILAFLCASGANRRGRHIANQDMLEETSGLPLVAFSSKLETPNIDAPEEPSCVGSTEFGTMDCKLLFHSNSAYYFFRPIPKSLAQSYDKLDVYILPDSEITGVHLQRGITLKK